MFKETIENSPNKAGVVLATALSDQGRNAHGSIARHRGQCLVLQSACLSVV
ncbi:MAG: hypothetical protein IGR93_18125 [Hydrococcus sp. C42_A2020_068]|nr:hypothetical protein [Hydrococcus sp. C42_A2020_068]